MKIYIQIADGKKSYPIKASLKKPTQPLKTGPGRWETFLPTVTFAIDVKFDRSIFKESIASIAEFELTKEMIQSPAPQVDVTEIDSPTNITSE